MFTSNKHELISAHDCLSDHGLGRSTIIKHASMEPHLQRYIRCGAEQITLLCLVLTSPWHTLAVALQQVLYVSDEEERWYLMSIWEQNKKAEYKSISIAVSPYKAFPPPTRQTLTWQGNTRRKRSCKLGSMATNCAISLVGDWSLVWESDIQSVLGHHRFPPQHALEYIRYSQARYHAIDRFHQAWRREKDIRKLLVYSTNAYHAAELLNHLLHCGIVFDDRATSMEKFARG